MCSRFSGDQHFGAEDLKLITRRDQIINKRRSLNSEIENLDNYAKQMFSSSWMLKGLTPLINGSAGKLLEFEDWRNKQIDKERELPEDVPGPVYIKKMLKP